MTLARSLLSLLGLGVLAAADGATPAPAISPWGFCSSAEWFGEYPRFNPLMAEAGVRATRAFPEWNGIQPTPDTWNWKGADDLVADLKKNGMVASGGFWYFARWATPNGDTRTCPLKDLSAWSAYVSAATARYRDDIRDWEVYNEFNGSFANSKNKAKDYADLVVAAYDAAKAVDPGLRIGLSCANFDLGFFDGAIKAGAAKHFDFVAVHPYENLGQLADGGEAGYLSMATSLRTMLADNGEDPATPLWITEFGIQSTVKPDPERDALQADLLVKGHILALAQGFERICWFEARGPSYGHDTDHGVIRHDWSLRPCYHAWKAMTTILGQHPQYLGWVDLAEGGYGFVFAGAEGAVLSAWAPKASTRDVRFSAATTVADVLGERRALAADTVLTLTTSPVHVLGIPADLVAQAKANADKPFPWGGDFSSAIEVACRLGATNGDTGITQRNPQTTDVVHQLDHSYRTSHRRNGEGMYAYFRVDPRFAGFGAKNVEITIVAKRADPAKAVSVDLTYESLTGYKGTGTRCQIPEGEAWLTHSWTISDANFVGGWGWNFRTDIGGSAGNIAIQEVRVRKLAP